MRDPHFEHVLQSAPDLLNIVPYFDLGDVLITFPDSSNVLLQIAFGDPFYHDEHLVVLNKTFDVMRDVMMLQFFHELDFFDAVIPLFHIIHVKYFQEL